MEKRRLGDSDLEITPIGFGAWAAGGGGYRFGWGEQDDAESIAAMCRAVELGLNWIDTAPVYGMGRSERVVAKALREMGPRPPYVFTKCGLAWDDRRNIGHNLEPAALRREVEESLRRLAVDVIDLYQIHWPAPRTGGSDAGIERAWEMLARLREEQKVRFIGVSNFDVAQMRRIQSVAPITSLQPPYSLVNREVEEEILPFCADQGIGVIVYSPMAAGLLSGAMTRERVAAMPDDDWRKSFNPAFQEPALSRNLALVERLREIGAPHGRSPAEVAIAWTLRQEAVTAAIVGARRPAQVEGLVGAGAFRLGDEEIGEIEEALA